MHIFSSLGALVVMCLIIPSLMGLQQMGFIQSEQRLAASHLSRVQEASGDYVRKHQATLSTQASIGSGPEISVADLINDGQLMRGFQNRNIWGQSYRIYIRKPVDGNLTAVVLTTGGAARPQKKFVNAVIPGAALLAGGAAGFIPSGDISGQSAQTLHGAGAGWIVALGDLGIPSPGAGHLGALTNYDPTSLGQDQLYRVAVPGQPELNEMWTELDMTDHAIRNVSEMQFQEREQGAMEGNCSTPEEQGKLFMDKEQGLYLCRNGVMEVISDTGNSTQLRKTMLARNGDRIDKPVCPTGTNTTPMIFTAPTIAEAGYEAPPMTALQTWATSLGDTQWQVHMRLLTTDKNLGWVYPLENYGRIMVLIMCARNS